MAIPITSSSVVLRRHEIREADRLITLYTRTHGKVTVRARGIRKAKSKLASHMELGMVTNTSFVQGRSDVYTLTGAVSQVVPVPALISSLEVLPTLLHVLEVVDRLTEPGQADTRIYTLLVSVIHRLNQGVSQEVHQVPGAAANATSVLGVVALLRAQFDLQLLAYLGLLPQVHACVACSRGLSPQEGHRFSVSQGGVLCPVCADEDRAAAALSVPSLRLLRHFERSAFGEDASAIQCSQAVWQELLSHLDRWFAHLLSRETASSQLRGVVQKLSERVGSG